MSLYIKVPLIPPSVNHYKTRFRNGNTVVSKEALAFKQEIALEVNGRSVKNVFSVDILITLGKGERGDVDNFPKLVLDGLADCGAFHDRESKRVSDAHVRRLVVEVDRIERPDKGYTEVWVA